MFQKFVEWFRSLWSFSNPYVEAAYHDEYAYLREKYGIQQPFTEEDDECSE